MDFGKRAFYTGQVSGGTGIFQSLFHLCRKPLFGSGRNRGGLTFEDVGLHSGISSNSDGSDQATMGIAIGDVVGKGIAASLLMASVRASLRAYAQDVYDLDEIISRVNNALTRDTLDNEFATLWYGVFDPDTLRLTYCNAGHDPPMLLRDGEIHTLDTGGMIVGVQQDSEYEKGLFDMAPGDTLLLYTDGLVDSFNDAGEKFGRKRIEHALTESAEKSAADTINHILWQVRRFTGPRQGVDDTTLVVVKVEG